MQKVMFTCDICDKEIDLNIEPVYTYLLDYDYYETARTRVDLCKECAKKWLEPLKLNRNLKPI